MDSYFGHVWLVRLILQRALAGIYLIAFLVVVRQFKPLLENAVFSQCRTF